MSLLICLFGLALSVSAKEDSKVLTNIILINGEAYLVDMDERGEILKQHIYVADYFTSRQSHETLVRRSINRVQGIGSINDDDSSEIASTAKTLSSQELNVFPEAIITASRSKRKACNALLSIRQTVATDYGRSCQQAARHILQDIQRMFNSKGDATSDFFDEAIIANVTKQSPLSAVLLVSSTNPPPKPRVSNYWSWRPG